VNDYDRQPTLLDDLNTWFVRQQRTVFLIARTAGWTWRVK
jgi:hypothetical protein